MQMLADVLNMEVYICESSQTGALGSAIAGAAASGKGNLLSLMEVMSAKTRASFKPDLEKSVKYRELYGRYLQLSRIFEEADLLT